MLGAEGDSTAALPKKSVKGRSSAGTGRMASAAVIRRCTPGSSAGSSLSRCRPATAGRS